MLSDGRGCIKSSCLGSNAFLVRCTFISLFDDLAFNTMKDRNIKMLEGRQQLKMVRKKNPYNATCYMLLCGTVCPFLLLFSYLR